MSVIIRLQNLSWSATSTDIRRFFNGLSIPEGGVQIVGGQMGDAFIAFSTDEDARQAMMLDKDKINDVPVRLLLSSRSEMQRVIETARQQSLLMGQAPPTLQPVVAGPTTQQLFPMIAHKQLTVLPTTGLPMNNNFVFPGNVHSNAFLVGYPQHTNMTLNINPDLESAAISLLSPIPQDRVDNDMTAEFLNQSFSNSHSGSPSESSVHSSPGAPPKEQPMDKIRERTNRSIDHHSSKSRSRSRSAHRVQNSPSQVQIGTIRVKQNLDNTRNCRSYLQPSPNDERSLDKEEIRIMKNNFNSVESQADLDETVDPPISPWEMSPFLPSCQSSGSAHIPGLMENTSGIFSLSSTEKQTPITVSLSGTPNSVSIPALLANDDSTQVSINTSNYDILPSNYLLGGTDTCSQSSFSSVSQDISLLEPDESEEPDEPSPIFELIGSDSDTHLELPNNFESILSALHSRNEAGVPERLDGLPPLDNYQSTLQQTGNSLPQHAPLRQVSRTAQQLGPNVPQSAPFVANSRTINFATSNPYAHIYPNLFAEQSLASPTLGQAMEQRISSTTMQSSSEDNDLPLVQNNDFPPAAAVSEENISNSSCVKISNMCNSTSYSDLRKFFCGIYIPHNGIKMINDQYGLRTGVAYVHFSRPHLVQKALQRNECNLKGKLLTVEQVSEDDFRNAEDSYRPPIRGERSKLAAGQHENESATKNRFKTFDSDNNAEIMQQFTILFVRDMPNSATEQDLMKMFSNYSLYDIFLTENPDNRREAQAYVKFAKHKDAQLALDDKNRHMIGYRKVRISISNEKEMELAKNRRNQGGNELKVENVDKNPFKSVSNRNKVDACEDIEIKRELNVDNSNGSTYSVPQNDRNNNDNVAHFSRDPRVAKLAQLFPNTADTTENMPQTLRVDPRLERPRVSRSNNLSNSIPATSTASNSIGLQTSIDNIFNANSNVERNQQPANIGSINPFQQAMSAQNHAQGSKFVLMTNCDLNVRPQDIFDLLTFTNLKVIHIEPLRNQCNMLCGEFIVEFSEAKDAENCINLLNMSLVNSSTLNIQPITPQKIADRIGKPFMNCMPNSYSNIPQGPQPLFNFGNMNNQQGNNFNNMQMPINNFSNNHLDNNPHGNFYMNNSQHFGNKNNSSNHNFYGNNNNNNNNNNCNRNNAQMQNMYGNSAQQTNQMTNNGLPDKFSRSGCVVNMENVPYKAQLRDIQRFFGEFNLAEEDIIRRFNDDGTPTGDARVAFKSQAAARNAVDSRKRKMIFNRKIYLTIL